MSEPHPGDGDPKRHLTLPLPRCGQDLTKNVKRFTRDGPSLCLIAKICRGLKIAPTVTQGTQGRGVKRQLMSCLEVVEDILRQRKTSPEVEVRMKSQVVYDIVMTAKKTSINAGARGTTELTIFIELGKLNQNEAMITTEIGSTIQGVMSSSDENPREMTSIFVEGKNEMKAIFADGIVSWKKTTSAIDEEMNAVMSINEAEVVTSTKMNFKGLVVGIFPGVSLKAMTGTGKDVGREILKKDSLLIGIDGEMTSRGRICLTSKIRVTVPSRFFGNRWSLYLKAHTTVRKE